MSPRSSPGRELRLALVLLVASAVPVHASPYQLVWPQWGGPKRDGVSTETGWSAKGAAEPVWRGEVGRGYSGLVEVGGRLYTEGYDEAAGKDTVWCLDAETGEVLWSHSFPAEIWNRGHEGGTLTTPSVDGGVVYTLNREGKYHRYHAESGEVLEERDLRAELELEPPTWGFAASPLVLKDLVILNLGRVLAFDKESGEVAWDTPDYGHAYSTPRDFTVGERRLLAVFNGAGLVVLDLASGDQVYEKEWKHRYDVNAASPVVAGNRLFISSGMETGCALIEIGKNGGRVVWQNKTMNSKMTGCVLYQGYLYGFDETLFKCLNLEGHEMWRQRGLGNGALMIAGGRLVLVSGDGELVVAEASPEGYRELSRADVLDGGVYWTSPLLVNGLAYVRNSLGDLACLDHRAR